LDTGEDEEDDSGVGVGGEFIVPIFKGRLFK
jgi:hypothetical protein